MKRVAAFDLGSNSFLCLVAEMREAQVFPIDDMVEIVQLGQGVDKTGELHIEALLRARSCLEKFKDRANQSGATEFQAVATSAVRDAQNIEKFVKILDELKIKLKVLSGAEEAEMSFVGATVGRDSLGIGLVDVGGGSTELYFNDHDGRSFSESLNIGGVRLLERHLINDPPSENEIDALRKDIQGNLLGIQNPEIDGLLAVGGTPTTLACVYQHIEFDETKVEGFFLEKDMISKMIETFVNLSVEQRKGIVGLDPKRAATLPVGAILLEEILNQFGFDGYEVTTKGVRHGLAKEMLCES